MFSTLGRLLLRDIKILVLYDFVANLVTLISNTIGGNSKVSEYVRAVEAALAILEKVFSKDKKSHFAVGLKQKHEERTSFFTALRRQIGVAQKMPGSPSVAQAANNLKGKMKEYNWWQSGNLSYYQASGIIRPLLEQIGQEPFAQWVTEVSLETIVEGLKKSQEEFEALKQERIKERNEALTPQQKEIRKNLIEELLALLSVINFGARHEADVFGHLAGEIAKMIIDTNAITKAQQTRAESQNTELVANQSAVVSNDDDARETEIQAEVSMNQEIDSGDATDASIEV